MSPRCISVLAARGMLSVGRLISSQCLPFPCLSWQALAQGCSSAGSLVLLLSAH